MADRTFFADDIAEYLPSLLSTARRWTGNTADAEDLVQDAMLRAYRAYDRFEAGSNLRAWLFRILTNAHINNYRSKQRRPQSEGLEFDEEVPLYRRLRDAGALTGAESAEDELLRLFPEESVTDALAALPARYRDPVLLADAEQFSYKEIAEILDIPIGTVMSRLHRGRKALREALFEYAHEHHLLPVEFSEHGESDQKVSTTGPPETRPLTGRVPKAGAAVSRTQPTISAARPATEESSSDSANKPGTNVPGDRVGSLGAGAAT